MVFQCLWSLLVALVDVYAMIARCSIQCLYFTKVLALGDWVIIFFAFSISGNILAHLHELYVFLANSIYKGEPQPNLGIR
jgi:hypothetical protein